MHDPIPDEEIEAGTGTKRIKVTTLREIPPLGRMLKGPKESTVEIQELMSDCLWQPEARLNQPLRWRE